MSRFSIPSAAPALIALAALVAASLASTAPAEAQTVRLLPYVGVYSPLSEMGQVRSEGETLVTAGRRSASFAFGLGAEGSFLGTGLRVHAGYATSARVRAWGEECPQCSARSSLLTTGVALVHRPLPAVVPVRPQLLLGLALKRYDFDVRGAAGEGWGEVFRDQTRPALQLGAGVEAGLLGRAVQLELSGMVSRFEAGALGPGDPERRSLQTDLFLTLAVPMGG